MVYFCVLTIKVLKKQAIKKIQQLLDVV
jgi:hypothetical protein